jgi:hypothetical protein
MNVRKYLSASGLFKIIYARFEKIKDIRTDNQKISLADALMSAFAMFSLKDPSLLAFEERRATDGNLKRVYGIQTIPCDTQMRTIADEVAPEELRPLYKDMFPVQRPGPSATAAGQGHGKDGVHGRLLPIFFRWDRLLCIQ